MSTAKADPPPPPKRLRTPGLNAGTFGTVLFLLIALPCFISLLFVLGSPPNTDDGAWYNDLRYDDKVVVDGQEVQVKIQEQGPGRVQYARVLESAAPQPGDEATQTPEDSAEDSPEDSSEDAPAQTQDEPAADAQAAAPVVAHELFTGIEPMGTDQQGRSLFIRCLLGGAISLGVGLSAAMMAVFIGVTWGAMAGYIGGRTDAFMMRIVDVLYGLPYLLLVVLLSVAVSGVVDNISDGFVGIPDWAVWLWGKSFLVYWLAVVFGFAICFAIAVGVYWGAGLLCKHFGGFLDSVGFVLRLLAVLGGLVTIFAFLWSIVVGMLLPSMGEGGLAPVPEWIVTLLIDYPLIINLLTLVIAIGGVSWLTMARVIRGQVLSLKTEPFIEAARALGMSPLRTLRVHLLPNLVGPIVVYTTLAVPQAILQESFLSFLGIGVTEPLPSWGQLASVGIKELPALAMPELNQQFKWWLLVFPCVLLGLTLLSLNFMGDAMRERFDPRSKKRGA